MTGNQHLLDQLKDAVINMDDDKVKRLCSEVIDLKLDIQEAILNGLAAGMRKVGELYENDIYSIPELLICSETLDIGLEILKPYLSGASNKVNNYPNIIIGTVEGDIHSIGKNLVKLMLEVNGFVVKDLGEDVGSEVILNGIHENNAKLVALSTMMANTLSSMESIVKRISEEYPEVKIIVGGASVTKDTANRFKADGFGRNALEAVIISKNLLDIKE